MRGVWRETVVQRGDCAGRGGEAEEGGEGRDDGARSFGRVAEGAAVDVSVNCQ